MVRHQRSTKIVINVCFAKQFNNFADNTNHNDAKRFESWSIVLYVGDSNVRMPSNKERDLFWWLDNLDQLKLLQA